ncbi:hypothetical protein CMV_022547 [Castanea mollissima]|uniref:Uncharacterized protein n=1 Tax=Castanea mollissima TaxID=60419 RepID=A0A8J4QM10_9ROSI|nr:hypothetical protein CMV_022547 [Castanea mollissima]
MVALVASLLEEVASSQRPARTSLWHPLVEGVLGNALLVACVLVVASLPYPLEVSRKGLVACVSGVACSVVVCHLRSPQEEVACEVGGLLTGGFFYISKSRSGETKKHHSKE